MARRERTPPAPDAEAAAHSQRLLARIFDAIDAGGGMLPFDEYMAMALYEPGLGYYSAGQRRFGAGGDFTTAPLTAPLFSRTLARQCAEVLGELGGGDILEFGAGTGRMAADVLAELQARDALPARYLIVEVSAALRQEQAQAIKALPASVAQRVEWLDGLPEQPIRGVVLANEVMDALPVKRFQFNGELLEQTITREGEILGWTTTAPAPALARAVADIQARLPEPWPGGYVSEWCPGLAGWIGSLADVIDRGVALLVDYGYPRHEYYHPQRAMGTLLCHYRHRAHDDPLWLPGLQDITAFVDFSAAADAAAAAGLDVLGYNTQAHFLMGAGITRLVEEVAGAGSDADVAAVNQQAKTLIMPQGMGERFKVLAVGRGCDAPLAGFSLVDQRHKL
ncbi:SAM-dependent methyltransferase [Ectothiorhodospiraceae bacterium WFHF3C12]|nr:SAM-dependent methyltransferase [Ectothiorhodospiraceae bacterium WFHF3C12]